MPLTLKTRLAIVILLIEVLSGCGVLHNRSSSKPVAESLPPPVAATPTPTEMSPPAIKRVRPADEIAVRIVAGAKKQEGTLYDPAYVSIAYPNGDVPADRGACTDVVVRALRHAGYDLQRLIHEDMKRNFRAYPRKWGLTRTDRNIDHRRVPNHMRFFERQGQTLTKTVSQSTLKQWKPGDVVCWQLPGNLYHTGIVTDGLSARGTPLVMHNLSCCAEEDVLTTWPIIGHYRFPKRSGKASVRGR